ncbi:MAG TPA: hypothetical protein VJB60_00560 [Candidatus Peribacterales bacterium]|nr:hypothetical protein [Candidatus Peribacterales bacterium]
MRSLKFVLGALGGLFGGMLLTNKNLRKKIRDAKDPKQAAQILGQEVHRGSKELAKEAKEWAQSEEAQKQWKNLKKNVKKGYNTIQDEAGNIAGIAVEKTKEHLPDATHKVEEVYKKAKKQVEKWS